MNKYAPSDIGEEIILRLKDIILFLEKKSGRREDGDELPITLSSKQ